MIIKAIKDRKSIRNYVQEASVSDEQIKELLEAAMLAPSACNSRPWEFIVVQNRDKFDKNITVHSYTQMLTTASCAIVVCADLNLQSWCI
ncbi:MAG: nitroreductase family protein [Nitrososphaerota archaeon]|nr:nitroreductase family protein [Nitrososphaerota archaeon]